MLSSLLATHQYKEIIAENLAFLVKVPRNFVYGFVIMDNPLNLIWQ